MKTILSVLCLSLISITFLNCQQKAGEQSTSRKPASLHGSLGFTSTDVFQSFPKVMEFTLVKFVATLNTQGQVTRVEFIDPRVFDFHHQYMSQLSEFKGWGYPEFKAITYTNQNRRFVFGALSLKEMDFGEGQWQSWVRLNTNTEEAIAAETFQKIATMSKEWWAKNSDENDGGTSDEDFGIVAPFELSQREYVLQVSSHQVESAQAQLKDYTSKNIEVRFDRVANSSMIYTAGWGMGKTLIIESEAQLQQMVASNEVTPKSILILKEAVNELPPVAGIISAVPLTEASHMVLLAQMYGIPLVYEKNALTRRRGAQGKMSLLQSQLGENEQYGFVEHLTDQEVQDLNTLQREKKLNISVDWNPSKIEEVSVLNSQQVKSYGGKAVNFGLLRRHISSNTRDRAYGIPLKYFKDFTLTAEHNGKKLNQLIQETVLSLGLNPTHSDVNVKTALLREAFKKAQISPDFFEKIRQDLIKVYPGQGVRLKLRSSSNVEDGAEFNAAGLYESEGVCLSGCPKDDFASGLRKVWGSIYTTRGFWARRQFQVNEADVGMGILVNQPYKGEVANGVAKLKWKKDEEGTGYLEVLGVLGEDESITNPLEKGSNEFASFEDSRLVNHRPLKGLPIGRLMMERNHYQKLNELMITLAKNWPRQTNELEIESEWKQIPTASGGTMIHIKQVREIPKPNLGAWPQGKTKYFSGQRVMMTSSLPNEGAMALYARFQDVDFQIDPFTEREFLAKKLRVGALTLAGKIDRFELSFKGLGELSQWDGGASLVLEFSHPRFKSVEMTLTIFTSLETPPVQTVYQTSPRIKIQLKKNNEYFDYSLLPKVPESEVLIAESRQMVCQNNNEPDSCPVKIQSCRSEKRWLQGDDEFRAFDVVEISGLDSKNVRLEGASALYYLQQHEGREGFFFDLSTAQNITSAAREKLIKTKGRFLHFSDYGGAMFLNEKLEETLELKKCSGQSQNEEE